MRTVLFCTIPFFCCIAGYLAMSHVMNVAGVVAPDVVGCSLTEALSHLSEMQLYGHIITEQEDPDIAEGTILEQMPRAGCSMKMRQSVGLIVVKKPKKLVAFPSVGKLVSEIKQEAALQGIKVKVHEIAMEGVSEACYAQYPRAGQEITDRAMHIYSIKPRIMLCIMPNFIGLSLAEIKQIIVPLGIAMRVFHEGSSSSLDHDCDFCVVKDQKPAPGELIDKKLTRILHLQVSKKS